MKDVTGQAKRVSLAVTIYKESIKSFPGSRHTGIPLKKIKIKTNEKTNYDLQGKHILDTVYFFFVQTVP